MFSWEGQLNVQFCLISQFTSQQFKARGLVSLKLLFLSNLSAIKLIQI